MACGQDVQDARSPQLMRIAWRTVGWICERVSDEATAHVATCSPGSGASGSTRSRSARASATSPSSSTTTPAGWCGRPRPRPQDGRAVPRSARRRALRADRAGVLRHGRLDHRARSPSAARTRASAWTRFTSSSSRPTRWTRSAARSGTRPAAQGQPQLAKELKGARFALWKNPENLTPASSSSSPASSRLNQRLYRAYLLAQQLREIYRVELEDAIALLDAWLKWARRCRLEPFVKLARTITEQRAGIEAAIHHGLSNARVEQINTQIRLITRRAFGFHSPDAVIALAMLALGGLCPPLPGRDTTHGTCRRFLNSLPRACRRRPRTLTDLAGTHEVVERRQRLLQRRLAVPLGAPGRGRCGRSRAGAGSPRTRDHGAGARARRRWRRRPSGSAPWWRAGRRRVGRAGRSADDLLRRPVRVDVGGVDQVDRPRPGRGRPGARATRRRRSSPTWANRPRPPKVIVPSERAETRRPLRAELAVVHARQSGRVGARGPGQRRLPRHRPAPVVGHGACGRRRRERRHQPAAAWPTTRGPTRSRRRP